LTLGEGCGATQLTSRSYFPSLISAPFRSGLHEAFAFAIAACLIAAVASWSRGGRYVYGASLEVPPEPAPASSASDLGRVITPKEETEIARGVGRVHGNLEDSSLSGTPTVERWLGS
jgi:hypothetical protein